MLGYVDIANSTFISKTMFNITLMHSLSEVHGHSRGSSRIPCICSLSLTVRWEINTTMPCMSSDGVTVTRIAKIVGYN